MRGGAASGRARAAAPSSPARLSTPWLGGRSGRARVRMRGAPQRAELVPHRRRSRTAPCLGQRSGGRRIAEGDDLAW